ncbi:hypothetical protein NC653_011242 [Populus alba x Populus x berolinensis]|uniref:DNA-directed RNA polymerase n=1 Tax=Populus alba x Populus x berolinensis TaxID=444605 RepID=A0AAD6W7C7_9ROSI|nr:hypothetical protein NC653_011242 [Populus alba x Populus x berolinensis]
MTSTTMGPPPPRNPHPTTSTEAASTAEPESEPESKTSAVDEPQKISSTTTAAKPSMAPPPPTNPIPTPPETSTEQEKTKSKDPLVPYTIPEWSGPPCHKFSLEILKDGSIIDQFEVCEKGAYMFGRVELCDFILEHPTISRFHAVLQFKRNGDAYLYDLGSTHGTFVNKSQIKTSLQFLTLQKETDKVMVKRQRTAFPPNFVHSLDGSHMMMTAVACKRAGLKFAGVHDSYWTHACDVDEMNRILREKFVELYETPILKNLLESFEKSFPTLSFPPLPEWGDFELRQVLESPYFFN